MLVEFTLFSSQPVKKTTTFFVSLFFHCALQGIIPVPRDHSSSPELVSYCVIPMQLKSPWIIRKSEDDSCSSVVKN